LSSCIFSKTSEIHVNSVQKVVELAQKSTDFVLRIIHSNLTP
jgi:hypothetical protein